MSRHPRIRVQILRGMLLIAALMTLAAGVILHQESVMRRSFEWMERIDELEFLLLECRRQEKNYLLRRDEASLALYRDHLEALLAATRELGVQVREAPLEDRLARLESRVRRYAVAFEELRAAFGEASVFGEDSGSVAVARTAEVEGATVARARECHVLLDEIRRLAADRFEGASTAARTVSVLSVILGLLISITMAVLLTRRLVVPLEYLRRLAEDVTHGDLMGGDLQDMDVALADADPERFKSRESFELARALQRMVHRLRELIATEQGLMDDYHMTIAVLVKRAVGTDGWGVIDRACKRAGLGSFADVEPRTAELFFEALEEELAGEMAPEKITLLGEALRRYQG